MAKVDRRPLLTFQSSTPPRQGERGHDFRTLQERTTEHEPLVEALVRDVRARQGMVRAIRADEEDASPLPFIGSMATDDGVGAVPASIRRTLDFDIAAFRAQGSTEAAFDTFWTEPADPDDPLIEEQGFFLSPHVAGLTDVSIDIVTDAVADNIGRLLDDREFLNVVSR